MAQTELAKDTSLLSLSMVARHHGLDLGVNHIAHEYAIAPGAAVGTTLLLRIAKENGFKAKLVTIGWDDLPGLTIPIR